MKKTSTHLYFWEGFLGNWHPCNFEDEGVKFNCAEQCFMYKKAKLFNEEEISQKILESADPLEHKFYGREINNFDPNLWDQEKYSIMVEVVYLKFSQNERLKDFLIHTDKLILVEGSPDDTVWGVGLHWDSEAILDESKWEGENLLGKALMDVRKSFKLFR